MTRVFFVLVVLFGGTRCFAQAPQPADVDESFTISILSVVSGTDGRCLHPRLTLRRSGRESPLAVAVVEDVPGGAGESIRASIWQAAMVAALERMDPLSGVRISLEVAGAADGPSGGAAVCLAILSALDGREFPADTAVTGAIMPDGTVGGVGGVAIKMRAAAKGKLRRVFIPPYLRFEKQPDGNELDLKRLATELKIELIPVENIAQAYAALHGLEAAPQSGADLVAPSLSEATEEALKARYAHHRQAALKIWEGVPAADRESLASEPSLKAIFIDDEAEAAGAYRAGRLCLAARTAWKWHMALAARQLRIAALKAGDPKAFDQHDAAGVAAKIDEEFRKTVGEFPTSATLLTLDSQSSESSVQLYADYVPLIGGLGPCDAIRTEIEKALEKAKQVGLKPEDVVAVRDEVFGLGQLQLIVAERALESVRTWPAERKAVAATLPLRPIVADPTAIERLFFSSQWAARNTFRRDIIEPYAKELKVTSSDLFVHLQSLDMGLAMNERAAEPIDEFHRRAIARTKPDERRFALAVSAHLHAEALAAQAGLIARWNQLDAELTEGGGFSYGRSDLLNYLLTAARANALRAMAACREKELVCLAAIEHFETAENGRDHARADKVDVLTAYWKASLQAKALLMLCGPTQNLPAPAKSAPSGAVSPGSAKASGAAIPEAAATTFKPSPPTMGPTTTDLLGLRSPSIGQPGYRPLPFTNSPHPQYGNGRRRFGVGTNSSSEGTAAGWIIVIAIASTYWMLRRWAKRKTTPLNGTAIPTSEVVAVTPPENTSGAEKLHSTVRVPWLFRVFIRLLIAVACAGALGLVGCVLWLLAYALGLI